ncbi:MAG: hypothetical protein ALECFALPRED_004022 [Alectoria fallacina]|uniref:G domain-containing protein n=1 Tax=Alectoria fallacina TaxID=1903189 RepID=A0A8H3I7I6_9LECA|nr:MAG: hypothetical protein ALECFALPRED_004022 [Alectoria fallacina]
MGVTGTGKSSFIADCIGKPVDDQMIGHGLRSRKLHTNAPLILAYSTPGTGRVAVYTLKYNDHTVRLIDTPGFDDTSLSDTDVLTAVAQCFHETYSVDIKLSGIIYIHRISDPRMTGNALKNLEMFKKMCGEESLECVVLATTMWDSVAQRLGNAREEELVSEPLFWGSMKLLGSMVERLSGDKGTEARHNSAMNIVQKIVLKKKKIVLDIQREMVDDHKPLAETSAGQELDKGLREAKLKHQKELKSIQDSMKKADAKTRSLLEDHEKHYQEKLTRLDKDQEILNMSIAEMYKQKEEQLREIIQMKKDQEHQAQQLEARIKRRESELESQYHNQKQAFEKERSEMKASTKAQQEKILQQDANMAKKLQKLENEHAQELRELRAQAQMSQLNNAPASGSAGGALGSFILPMVMVAMIAGGMGGLGGLGS